MRESLQRIDGLLRESPAFQALAESQRHRVAADLAVVAAFLRPEAGPPRAGKGLRTGPRLGALLREVALPEFVRALVAGTFQAVVDASLQQMKAYAELMAAMARSVDSLRGDADLRAEVAARLEQRLREIFVIEGGPEAESR
jgi:hypothetical protein